MRPAIFVSLISIGLWPTAVLFAQSVPVEGVEPVYSVDTYDPAADPFEDLARSSELASDTGRHILIEVGGTWCTWCYALEGYWHDNQDVATALRDNYVIMKVNFSEENRNEEFLGRYPEIPGYPHLFVLDSDGEFLHSQGTGELEEGRSYNKEAMMTFLKNWAPADSE